MTSKDVATNCQAIPDFELNVRVLTHVLDAVDYGLAILANDYRIVAANRSALAILEDGHFIVAAANRLIASGNTNRERLSHAVSQAFRGRRALMTLSSGEATLTCTAMPVTPTDQFHAVLLVMGRPHICQPLALSLFSQQAGLSAAESAVLQGLSNGLEPTQIAQRHGVALNTVRTQILSIRSKTRAPNIRNLVQRIATLPPVLPMSGVTRQ